jgi:hypothetical protein
MSSLGLAERPRDRVEMDRRQRSKRIHRQGVGGVRRTMKVVSVKPQPELPAASWQREGERGALANDDVNRLTCALSLTVSPATIAVSSRKTRRD